MRANIPRETLGVRVDAAEGDRPQLLFHERLQAGPDAVAKGVLRCRVVLGRVPGAHGVDNLLHGKVEGVRHAGLARPAGLDLPAGFREERAGGHMDGLAPEDLRGLEGLRGRVHDSVDAELPRDPAPELYLFIPLFLVRERAFFGAAVRAAGFDGETRKEASDVASPRS